MAYNYGLETIQFGAPIITGFVTKTSGLDFSNNVAAIVENETGSIVARRYDDVVTKATFEGYINNGTGSLLQVGQEFVYSSSLLSSKFICEKFSVKYDAKNFTQFSCEGVTSQYLPLP